MVRRRILEQAALVLSIAKWTALATLTGVVVGAATAWFLQSLDAGIISYQTSRALGLTYFHHTLTVVPGFTEVRFLKLIGVGLVIGLGALLLIEALTVVQAAFRRLKVRQVLKPALGALLVLVVAGTASADYLGLGMAQIEQAIDGQRLGIRKSEALKVPLQEMVGRIEGGVELTEGGRAWLTRVKRLGRRDRGTRA